MTRAPFVAFALALAAVGCGTERIDPLTRTAFGEPPDAGVELPGDAGPAAPMKRAVVTRNPFGGPPENLFVDGDFELSVARDGDTGQYGWIAFSSSAPTTFKAETGGLCRTGIRCAAIDPDTYLFGRGAAAHGAGLLVSVAAKLAPNVACSKLRAFAMTCDDVSPVKELTASSAPEADGWCSYEAKLAPQQTAICMYVDSGALAAKTIALVDSAVMIPDDGTPRRYGNAWAPSARDAERLETIRRYLRRRIDPRPPRFGSRADRD